MTTIVTGVFTNLGRETLAKSFGSVGGYSLCSAKYFKIGMGGFVVTPLGRSPKDPNPSLTEIEATGGAGDFLYQKDFTSDDITFISPSIIQIRCRLAPSEANDDGTGEPPRFFEIGIFDENDNMIIYSTFPEETKAVNKILSNYVQAYF